MPESSVKRLTASPPITFIPTANLALRSNSFQVGVDGSNIAFRAENDGGLFSVYSRVWNDFDHYQGRSAYTFLTSTNPTAAIRSTSA